MRIIGWVFSVLGAIPFCLMLIVALENKPENWSAVYGFLAIAVIFGIPGVTLLWGARRRKARADLRRMLLGHVRSRDAFTVEELAGRIGKNREETERILVRLIGEEGLDLAFHRGTKQYVHRDRLESAHRYLRNCPSCSAPIGHQIIFSHEKFQCSYCGSSISMETASEAHPGARPAS